MPYGSISESKARSFSSFGSRQPPYSNPPAVLALQNMDAKSTSRSGGLSPYVKGGVAYIFRETFKPYKTIVAKRRVPKRIIRKARRPNGTSYTYVDIVYVDKNVWGTVMRKVIVKERVQVPDSGLLLLPNNLLYQSHTTQESDGVSSFVAYPGLPFQTAITSFQSGALPGQLSGYSASLGPNTDPFQSVPFPSAQFEQLKRQALSKLYSRVQDQKANLAMLAVESKKTFGLLSDIFFGGIKFVRSLRKLDVLAARKALNGLTRQQISSQWLAYQYGVRPLISDAMKIAEDIGGSTRDWRKYQSRASLDDALVSVSSPPITGVSFSYKQSLCVKCSVIIRTSASIPSLAQAYGFTEPLNIAWELVPFSFVVDWFYPIGSWLQSSHALDTNVLAYYETYYRSLMIDYSSSHASTVGDLIGGGSGPSGTKQQVYVSREVKAAPSMPLPSLNTSPFSINRIANAIALLNQRF